MVDIGIVDGLLSIAIVVGGYMLKDSYSLKELLNFVIGEVLHYVERGF